MRIRHSVIGAIAATALLLSACAGGAGTGTQSASSAASGEGGSTTSAASGAETTGVGQSDSDADSVASADSAASFGSADTAASAPEAVGGSQSAAGASAGEFGTAEDVKAVLELTHIPEGYEEVPDAPLPGIGYRNPTEGVIAVAAPDAGLFPSTFTAADGYIQARIPGLDVNTIKEGEKVSVDGAEFQTAYAPAEVGGQKAGTAIALGKHDDKVVILMFIAIDPTGTGNPEVDPAQVKSVIEGIKWKK